MDENIGSIGSVLKDSRIEQGYTLDDIQQKTKIQKRYLQALEDGNFELLPSNFYIRSFVREYARTLGMDADKLLDEHQDEIPKSNIQSDIVTESKNVKVTKSRLANNSSQNKFAKIKQYIPAAIVVIIVIAIMIGIFAITSGNKKDIGPKNPEPISVSHSSSSKKSSSSSSSSSKTDDKDKDKKSDDVSYVSTNGTTYNYKIDEKKITAPMIPVSVSSNTSAWVSVTASGSTIWQGNITPQNPQKLSIGKNATDITISSGNIKDTKITINNQPVDLNAAKPASSVGNIKITVEK